MWYQLARLARRRGIHHPSCEVVVVPRAWSSTHAVATSVSRAATHHTPARSFCTTIITRADASNQIEPELISIESIEVLSSSSNFDIAGVEALAAASTSFSATAAAVAETHDGSKTFMPRSHASGRGRCSVSLGEATQWPGSSPSDYWDVTKVDQYARSRIVNFIRRVGSASGPVFSVHCTDTMTGFEGRQLFIATCQLPLPEPHGLYVAEGVGESAKDAELLAAMHAERVCDALGVPLFRLPSMQKKHADAVRREEGRYAPYPGDPIQPEGTPVPSPLRMVSGMVDSHQNSTAPPSHSPKASDAMAPSLNTISTATHIIDRPRFSRVQSPPQPPPATEASSSRRGDAPSPSPTLQEGSVEMTLVRHGTSTSRDVWEKSPLTTTGGLTSIDVEGEAGEDSSAAEVQSYASSVWYPWLPNPNDRTTSSPVAPPSAAGYFGQSNTPVALPTAATTFDPTENGVWRVVNATSTRCSPFPKDALVLPYVYDGANAMERLKDYYLQHHRPLKDQLSVKHVAVPGHSSRMYEAQLRLVHLSVVAQGKAQTSEMAVNLAAMHAELLLDALGQPLFPSDDERQARHAKVVAGFGRWAPNPVTGDIAPPRPNDPLPLPLKQQVGGDEVWLTPQALSQQRSSRTEGERIIAAHNDINFHCGDYVEVNPPPELLEEAAVVLRNWQTEVARSPFPHLFIITVMGDFYRATTITPVPHRFGLRGGNAVGRTIDQAIQLCALHAVDGLCSLGIPLFTDRVRQEQYIRRRRLLGLATRDAMEGLVQPMGVVGHLSPSISPSIRSSSAGENTTTENRSLQGLLDAHKPREKLTTPYIPGYLIEGNQTRLLPHIDDTLHILQLRIPEDFAFFGRREHAEEQLVAVGNDVRVCVQNYLRHHDSISKAATKVTKASASRQAADGEGEDVVLRQWQSKFPLNVNPSVYITGYGRVGSVHNIAFLRMPLPSQAADSTSTTVAGSPPSSSSSYLLAVGVSLKKKDAERACYAHAAAMLYHHGEDVLAKYRFGLPRQSSNVSYRALEELLYSRVDNSNVMVSDVLCAAPQPTSPPPPFMHVNMKSFLDSGRHMTVPSRRGG